jgi:hypothetical protein
VTTLAGCLTGVTASSDTHLMFASCNAKICAVNASVTALALIYQLIMCGYKYLYCNLLRNIGLNLINLEWFLIVL